MPSRRSWGPRRRWCSCQEGSRRSSAHEGKEVSTRRSRSSSTRATVLLTSLPTHLLAYSWGQQVFIYKGHKGFVRMALRHRARLVPIFSMGEWELMGNVSCLVYLVSCLLAYLLTYLLTRRVGADGQCLVARHAARDAQGAPVCPCMCVLCMHVRACMCVLCMHVRAVRHGVVLGGSLAPCAQPRTHRRWASLRPLASTARTWLD